MPRRFLLAICHEIIYHIDMYKNLRIIFCILAAACAAVTIFIFVYFTLWGFIPLGGACIFALLMVLFKRKQESEELKKNPPPPTGDFITGKVEKDGDEK